MSAKRTPVFVERDAYRHRRRQDALRFVAVLGALLWMVPLLWPSAGMSMSNAIIYVFAIWALLIALAAGIVWRMARAPDLADPNDPVDDTARGG